MRIALMYVPVPHRGYRNFFSKLREMGCQQVWLLGEDVLELFPQLRKNLPALSPNEARISIEALGWAKCPVRVADVKALQSLKSFGSQVIMPDEDVSHELQTMFLAGVSVVFVNYFLRYDRKASLATMDVVPDVTISTDELDRIVMRRLSLETERSADFWRQVAGCIVWPDGAIGVAARNRHVPTDYNHYVFGDPRFNFSRGVEIDLGTAEHVERYLISICARDGIWTNRASLYVTTFPCPGCTKAIATAGFAKLYFRDGYTMVDSEGVLKAAGVQLIQVK